MASKNVQKHINDDVKSSIDELFRHADVANREMGEVKGHLSVLENDVKWIKSYLQKIDNRMWWILGTMVLTVMGTIISIVSAIKH